MRGASLLLRIRAVFASWSFLSYANNARWAPSRGAPQWDLYSVTWYLNRATPAILGIFVFFLPLLVPYLEPPSLAVRIARLLLLAAVTELLCSAS